MSQLGSDHEDATVVMRSGELRPVPEGPLHRLRTPVRLVLVLWANPRARAGLVLLGVFVFVAIFAPWLSPYSPTDDSFPPSTGPSADHPLGTTNLGQDVLSQLLHGSRVSLGVGLLAAFLSTIIAVVVGMLMGYLRGPAEHALGFLTNLTLVIPAVPLMIVLAAYVQGIWFLLVVLVITSWAFGARVIRAQTTSLRARDFVLSAQFSGDSSLRIVFREILPNMTSLVAATFFLTAMYAVLGEVSLEFIGLGDKETISWGTMLYWAQHGGGGALGGLWAWLLAPGLCIALLATSFSLINFGVDEVSNPRLHES